MPGRNAVAPTAWIAQQPQAWRDGVSWATLDLPGPCRKVFDTILPDAVRVADPFHLVKLANQRLDEVRRRVQNEMFGHRGHRDDPLYRARRLLTRADERLNDLGRSKLLGLLGPGDPRSEVRTAWHHCHVSIGPTEAANNLVKRAKRVAFGMTNFTNYRIRALLYAGKPNWDLLPTITPR